MRSAGESLMKCGQPLEGLSQASGAGGWVEIGRSSHPGSDFPESSIVLPDRSTLMIADGNGYESQVSRHEQPAMDPLDVFSAWTMRRPGAEDQRTLRRRVSPESCPAEPAGPAQGLWRRQRLSPQWISREDFLEGLNAHSCRPCQRLIHMNKNFDQLFSCATVE